MKRTFIAAALALSVGAAFANPDAVVIGAGGPFRSRYAPRPRPRSGGFRKNADDRRQYSAC